MATTPDRSPPPADHHHRRQRSSKSTTSTPSPVGWTSRNRWNRSYDVCDRTIPVYQCNTLQSPRNRLQSSSTQQTLASGDVGRQCDHGSAVNSLHVRRRAARSITTTFLLSFHCACRNKSDVIVIVIAGVRLFTCRACTFAVNSPDECMNECMNGLCIGVRYLMRKCSEHDAAVSDVIKYSACYDVTTITRLLTNLCQFCRRAVETRDNARRMRLGSWACRHAIASSYRFARMVNIEWLELNGFRVTNNARK